jgi:hypothetical protein
MNIGALNIVGARAVFDMQASPHGEQSRHASLERSAKSTFSNQQYQCPEQQQGTAGQRNDDCYDLFSVRRGEIKNRGFARTAQATAHSTILYVLTALTLLLSD